MPDTRLEEIMTTELVTVMEADNLATIAADFDVYRFRHLPVVDGKKLVGMVSERDLLRASVSQLDASRAAQSRSQHLSEDTFVRAIMNDDPITVGPDATVAQAAQKLIASRIGALPVVAADGALLGLVTQYDLLKHLAAAHL